MTSPTDLHPNLRELLTRLRRRVRSYIVWESVLVLALIVLGVFWVAFLIDYLPVRIGGSEMPRSARGVVLIGTLMALVVFGWRYLISRYRRELPDDSLALLIERHHPEIGGRLVTAVQLGGQPRPGDSHAPAFIRSVHQEAIGQVDRVDLNRIFRREPIVQKLLLVVPLLLAALILAIASPSTMARAVGRLTLMSDSPWPRRAALEMVGVEVFVIVANEDEKGRTELIAFEDQILRLARGSNASLRIRAAGEKYGHQIPEICTVNYTDDDGNRGQSNLRRVGRLVDGYQSFVLDGPPLTSLSQSVTLNIRGLDDRLNGYRVEAIEPPAISKLQMRVRYPDYLRMFDITENSVQPKSSVSDDFDAVDQTIDYQAGVRIREGSRLRLVGRSSVPLGEVDVIASTLESTQRDEKSDPTDRDRVLNAEITDDGMSFELNLDAVREATAVRIVPRDPTGISAQAPYRYFIGVVRDQVPETTMRLSGIGSSITPIAKLPITATATDDYGIESMKVITNVQSQPVDATVESEKGLEGGEDNDGGDNGVGPESVIQTYVVSPPLDREGQTELTIDLRELTDQQVLRTLRPGDTVTINTTVKDRFDLAEHHITNGELTRLQVVTPEELLATLERRELEFRSRLEQAIDETRRLRQSLMGIDTEAAELAEKENTAAAEGVENTERTESTDDQPNPEDVSQDVSQDGVRSRQRVQLRIRQAELQTAKTTDELAGIVSGIDDLLLEMLNNRIDSVDRRERLEAGVRDPLSAVVTEPFPELRRQITELERIVMAEELVAPEMPDLRRAVERAIATNDDILLQLSAVLEKMLDLESFNEILDLMRGLIQDQESLLEETEDAQQKRVLDLFK